MIQHRFIAGNVHKKKHKKHKKKLHRDDGHSFSSEALESDSGMLLLKSPQLKLKIKLGRQTLGTKNVPTITVIPEAKRSVLPLNVPSKGTVTWTHLLCRTWTRTRCWAARWLDVLEKGELDDNRELKKEIDESPLTARQKALLHKQQSQTLLELPMGYREEELTAEMMQKREERARKRRLQAAKKAEENKNQTIERLTKTKSKKKGKSKQAQLPMVRYSSNVQGAAVSYPAGIPIPTPTALPEPSPKYSCSRTGALCSLQCYRKNLTLGQEVA
uniref:INO80 complex subunit B n=1 Tax=Cyprinus carpio carpio TaxID=630221 RepID=A0A8C1HNJ6_CYPCA